MLTLSKDMEVGVKDIDDQHKELVAKINAVIQMGHKAASAEETKKLLNALGEYTDKHFKDEENLQIKSGYPKFEQHKQLHNACRAEFNRIKSEFMVYGPSTQFNIKVQKSVIDWIVRHIKSADQDFGKYYRTK